MNLEIQSRLSFYRRLEEVEHKKGIFLVRHIGEDMTELGELQASNSLLHIRYVLCVNKMEY